MFFPPDKRRLRTVEATCRLAESLAELANTNAQAAEGVRKLGKPDHAYMLIGEARAYAVAARKVLDLTKGM